MSQFQEWMDLYRLSKLPGGRMLLQRTLTKLRQSANYPSRHTLLRWVMVAGVFKQQIELHIGYMDIIIFPYLILGYNWIYPVQVPYVADL
jgi:hypothetical protein